MKYWPILIAAFAGSGLSQLASAVTAPAPAATPATAALDDARRVAAQHLLDASRFRARQAVLLDESIQVGRADLQADCLDRAASGRSLSGCDATGRAMPGTASRTAMLDEIMVASQTIYARRFTAAEMDEISRFFKTPVGQKYGQVYPQVIAEVQERKHAIVRKYLVAGGPPAPRKPS